MGETCNQDVALDPVARALSSWPPSGNSAPAPHTLVGLEAWNSLRLIQVSFASSPGIWLMAYGSWRVAGASGPYATCHTPYARFATSGYAAHRQKEDPRSN